MKFNIKIPYVYLDIFKYDFYDYLTIQYTDLNVNYKEVLKNPFITYLSNDKTAIEGLNSIIEMAKLSETSNDSFFINIANNLVKHYSFIDCEIDIFNSISFFDRYVVLNYRPINPDIANILEQLYNIRNSQLNS